MTTLERITSFASLLLNAGRIRTIVDESEKQYLGCEVTQTFPNGSTRRAVIEQIEWCSSCGLAGDWLIFVRYSDNQYTPEKRLLTAPTSWVTRDELKVE